MCTNKFILFCMGIVMSVSSSAWAGDDIPLYKDRTAPIEKRVDDLMSRMTLHEKVLQLQNRASAGWMRLTGSSRGKVMGQLMK
jgi:beta-glucosidase